MKEPFDDYFIQKVKIFKNKRMEMMDLTILTEANEYLKEPFDDISYRM